jgi:serine/threonine protein kinase
MTGASRRRRPPVAPFGDFGRTTPATREDTGCPGPYTGRMPAAGQIIADRYRLERPLDSGSMGNLWVAINLKENSPVAIKFQHRTTRNPTADARFRREARAAGLLRSPHVVHILDYGFDGAVPFIAMELLTGQSVSAKLGAGWPLSLRQVATAASQAAQALELAHASGIIHRDIKPSNLFVAQEAGGDVVKLLDFGIAKWIDPAAVGSVITDSTMVIGSVAYMSPEQARGEAVDHRTDVWSLGVVAYQMVTGVSPFAGGSILEILNRIWSGQWDLPSALIGSEYAALDSVFTKVLQRDRTQRFQSAGAFSDALIQTTQQMSPAVLDAILARVSGADGGPDETRTIT